MVLRAAPITDEKSVAGSLRSMTSSRAAGHEVHNAHPDSWPSNAAGVRFDDLGRELGLHGAGLRQWRLAPGQASVRHRHVRETEIYVLVAGTGRVWIDGKAITLEPGAAVRVGPQAARQLFNDTDEDQWWLAVGAPPDPALTSSDALTAYRFPDGFDARPPTLTSREVDTLSA